MTTGEMVKLFLESRKHGLTGARKRCTPRTIRVYQANLDQFVGFLQAECGGIIHYEDIKRLHMMQFLGSLDEKVSSGKWSQATRLQILRSLKAFFRWVDKDEDLFDRDDKPLAGLQRYLPAIQANPARTDIPPNADLKKFKNAFNTSDTWGFRNYVVTCLMIDTGVRAGEVCNLKLNAIRMDERSMIVDGKTGPRLVRFTREMERLLRGWLRRRPQCGRADASEYVFVSKRGDQMDPNTIGQAFRKLRKVHSLPRISAHTFRHAFCTNFCGKDGNLERLRMLTGHRSLQTLMKYLHLSEVSSKEMGEELERVSLLKDI